MHRSANAHGPSTVLFVSLSGWLAGPGRSLSTLIAHLPQGIKVALASPTVGDLRSAIEANRPLRAHIALPRHGQSSDVRSRIRAVLILARWMAVHRRELIAVHANGFSELHVAAPGALAIRLPVVVWFLGHEENPWDLRLGKVWGRHVHFKGVAAISDIAKTRAVSARVATAEAIEIIPTPIDPLDTLVMTSRRSPQADGPIVVGFFGGTTLHKGMQLLPELVRRVGQNVATWSVFSDEPDARELAVMGASWRELHEFGREWVTVKPYAADVRDAFAPCDVVLTMSTAEAFGRTVAEAMLNGIPVVATDIPAHRSLIGDNEAGILFPAGDLDSAAAAIRQLALDATLREQMSSAGRARAAAFDPEVISARFSELYMAPR